MLLSELNDNQLLVKLVALASRIKHNLKHSDHKREPWMNSKEGLLDYLADHDIFIDEEDLNSMIADKKGPLSQVISNIQGDNIVWVTDGDSPEVEQSALDAEAQEAENQSIVGDMAQKALSKK